MRRIAIVGMILVSLVAVPLVAAAAPGEKSEVCHLQDDGEMKTLTVGGKALQAHLNHGDAEGACDEAPPAEEPPAVEPLVATFSHAIECGADPDDPFASCDVVVSASVSAEGSFTFVWSVDGVVFTHLGAEFAFPAFDGMTHLVTLQVSDGDRVSDLYQDTITVSLP